MSHQSHQEVFVAYGAVLFSGLLFVRVNSEKEETGALKDLFILD